MSVISVCLVWPSTSTSAPPFWVTSMRPSGKNASAVGWERPVATAVSAKPGIRDSPRL